MMLLQLVMPRESAHHIILNLGEIDCVQFKDLSQFQTGKSKAWEKKFLPEVKRCTDLEAKIDFFERLLGENAERDGTEFDIYRDPEFSVFQKLSLDGVDEYLTKKRDELNNLKITLKKLYSEIARSQEYLAILDKTDAYMPKEEIIHTPEQGQELQDVNLQHAIGPVTHILQNIVGVIPEADIATFQMILYRQTRGNMILTTIPIEGVIFDGVGADNKFKFVPKCVFILNISSEHLSGKCLKHCQNAGHVFDLPIGLNVPEIIQVEHTKISQLKETLNLSEGRMGTLLEETCHYLDGFKKFIAVEKAIFDTMNRFDYGMQNSCVAEIWIPSKKEKEVRAAIQNGSHMAHAQVDTHVEQVYTNEKHPTYFETNKFTQVFQDMTDAYAVPAYKEINPSPITMITFPFLYAVMYGDLGHGTILFCVSLILVVFEDQLRDAMEANELLVMLFGGRYMLLLMSIFALYTGLLYNDVYGVGLNLWGSRWSFDSLGVATFSHNTYEFGVDPAWYDTTNKLMYYNSVKMKMAIIFGVSHMLLGTVIKFFNFLNFRQYAFVFMEAIPEFIILGFSFGYLCFMIIYKWCINWQANSAPAPDLLRTMTDFFLHFADPISTPLYGGQQWVQNTLLLLCVVSVPILLIPSPIYHIVEHYIKVARGIEDTSHGAEFSIQEVVIHQVIHTIEYVLGAVSNTASYLRLWALSLAHAQLSEVFFTLSIKLVLTLGGLIPQFNGRDILIQVIDYTAIPMLVAFTVWLFLTLAVLLGMEVLSAFLHALRLHWVEFNSKFYKGEGLPHTPLSFREILKTTTATVNNGDKKENK
jgi:V-type H+-transporting ATPase subunit a